jgi:hypothetical protein
MFRGRPLTLHKTTVSHSKVVPTIALLANHILEMMSTRVWTQPCSIAPRHPFLAEHANLPLLLRYRLGWINLKVRCCYAFG